MLTLFFLIKNIQFQGFCFLGNYRSHPEVRTLPMKEIAEPTPRLKNKNYSEDMGQVARALSPHDRNVTN